MYVRSLVKSAALLLTLVLACAQLLAQENTTTRSKSIQLLADSTQIDTLPIVPGSFVAMHDGDTLLEGLQFKLLYPTATWVQIEPISGQVDLKYEVFPAPLSFSVNHKELPETTANIPSSFNPYTYTPSDFRQGVSPFSEESLQRQGSISRGIAFGNTQDLSVNSSLNLQLSGRLNSRFQVLAAITDDNIPIQPDGNTRQIQEFDRVYIQIFDEQIKLTAGDFQMRRQDNQFLYFSKRAQGGRFESQWAPTGDLTERTMRLEASAALSKGKFARNRIQGIEGNQGPYRLTGSEGESFIIVLAGTEQVFIDGVLMERGEGEDYIINYNTAEIIFTPRHLITKDRRIVVDFQYATFNYARSLVQARVESTTAKTQVYVEAYSEQDAKNQSLQQELSPQDRLTLANAGDNALFATTSGVDSVDFSNNQVLYARIDSLGYDSVYVLSNDPNAAFFNVRFSQVGQGLGDYITSEFTANGKTYSWVAPDTLNGQIVRQGNFAPVLLLEAPEQRQMVVAGARWNPNDKTTLSGELAYSNNDVNTFSSLNAANDQGWAGKVRAERQFRLGQDSTGWRARLFGEQEYTDPNFNGIEQFRKAEFQRDWNLAQNADIRESATSQLGAGIVHPQLGSLSVQGDRFAVDDTYLGNRASLLSDLRIRRWSLTGTASMLESQNDTLSTLFSRHKLDLKKTWKKISVGLSDEYENNRFRSDNQEGLLGTSYQFFDWQAYVAQGDSSRNSYRVYFRQRTDRLAAEGLLTQSALANEYGVNTSLNTIKNQRFTVSVSQRDLTIQREDLIDTQPEQSLLMRLDHQIKIKGGFIQAQTFYETATGLELRREFVYLEVPEGQGVYVWNDYNGDGVKDLNEFEIAAFDYEANYIRSAIPSNEYVKVFSNQISETLQLNPSRLWNTTEGVKGFVSRFSGLLAYRATRKLGEGGNQYRFNPLEGSIPDSLLLALTQSTRASMFFNRSNPKFSADFTYQNNSAQTLLTNGIEARKDRFNEVNVRALLREDFTLVFSVKEGNRSSNADFLAGRNFNVQYREMKPLLTWQRGVKWRVSTFYELVLKENIDFEGGGELSQLNTIGLEAKYSQAAKGSLSATLNYIAVAYDGPQNTPLAFELLEGLQAGNNVTWSANWQRYVSKNVQLNLIYDGRSAGDSPNIHRGSVQVRAFF